MFYKDFVDPVASKSSASSMGLAELFRILVVKLTIQIWQKYYIYS
jgi:hypothetical protein